MTVKDLTDRARGLAAESDADEALKAAVNALATAVEQVSVYAGAPQVPGAQVPRD